MRLFVAIELPARHRAALTQWIEARRATARDVGWSREAQLHITLRFLGEVPEPDVPRVCDAVEAAAAKIAPFDLSLSQLGAFPSAGSPRVLWIGVEDAGEDCQRWVRAADPRFAALGLTFDDRPLVPHVTLARSRSRAGGAALRAVLGLKPPESLPPFPAREVTLLASRLGRGGPEYTPLRRAALVG